MHGSRASLACRCVEKRGTKHFVVRRYVAVDMTPREKISYISQKKQTNKHTNKKRWNELRRHELCNKLLKPFATHLYAKDARGICPTWWLIDSCRIFRARPRSKYSADAKEMARTPTPDIDFFLCSFDSSYFSVCVRVVSGRGQKRLSHAQICLP